MILSVYLDEARQTIVTFDEDGVQTIYGWDEYEEVKQIAPAESHYVYGNLRSSPVFVDRESFWKNFAEAHLG